MAAPKNGDLRGGVDDDTFAVDIVISAQLSTIKRIGSNSL